MMRIVLSDHERQKLAELVMRPTQATVLQRAQALLWLHAGESVPEVAGRLRVSRYTVYNWVQGYQDSHASDVMVRLTAPPQPAQSQAVQGVIAPLILVVKGITPVCPYSYD